MSSPIVVKGCPRDKWDDVQDLVAKGRVFIYIMHNGSKWAGEEPDDISTLLDVLSNYTLDPERSYYSINPREGIQVAIGKFIDGELLYPYPNTTVIRFSGNFIDYSHAFGIDTNHGDTAQLLIEAFERQGITASD